MIYFDNASTNKPKQEVLNTYNNIVTNFFANPSSTHSLGNQSLRILEKARESIIKEFSLQNTHEVIFTSGASESINLAIKGYCLKYSNRGKHIITSEIEHPSVLESFEWLKQFGFEITYLPVNSEGKLNLVDLKSAIRKDTILVSIMAVNNEIGSINDIEQIGSYLEGFPKIVFHVDATQAIGKVNINYKTVDMFSFTAHKIGGLKGSGCLIKSKKINLLANISGGGQENKQRSGTNDVAGCCALQTALSLSMKDISKKVDYCNNIISLLDDYISSKPDLYKRNSPKDCLVFIYNFSLLTAKASVIVEALSNEGIMVSSISACSSKKEKSSHVVFAISKDENIAHNTIRVSINENNTIEEMKTFITSLDRLVKEKKR